MKRRGQSLIGSIGVYLVVCLLSFKPGYALDREMLKRELRGIGQTLHRAILAGQTGPIIQLLAQPVVQEVRQDGTTVLVGGAIQLTEGGCEDSGTVYALEIEEMFQKQEGEAYARMFDTAQYRTLHSGEYEYECRVGMGCLWGNKWHSVRDHFLRAGDNLWLWVEVHIPVEPWEEGRPPWGIVHYEWQERGKTEYSNPGFAYLGGRWQLTDFFTIFDAGTNVLYRMGTHTLQGLREDRVIARRKPWGTMQRLLTKRMQFAAP